MASSIPKSIVVSMFVKQAKTCLAVLAFIGFICFDAFQALKRKAIWIPPGALVLGAFTLQLLNVLDDSNVSIADYPEFQKYSLEILLKKNLLVDGGRVIVCIYMAYLLPSMAGSDDNGVKLWGDMGALAISVLSHITSELYVFKQQSDEWCINKKESTDLCIHMLSVVFRLCVLVWTILLFIFLASAAFAGRTIYNMVVQKIPLALSSQVIIEEESTSNLDLRETIQGIKHDVLQSWIVVWVSKPDYVIARSVLSSGVGIVTTICVVFYGVEYISENYKATHFHDGIDWLRYTTTALECLLILAGWFIILCRWITAVIYFPKHWTCPLHVEDFWTRHFFEMICELECPWRRSWEEQVSSGGFLKNLKLKICRFFRLHKWLLPLFVMMQTLTVWFSKLSCFLSKLMFFAFHTLCVQQWIDETFIDPLEKLALPGETAEMLWTATEKAFRKTENFMRKGYEDAIHTNDNLVALILRRSSNELFVGEFLSSLNQVEGLKVDKDFMNMKQVSWKMTVLSLIRVMMELGAMKEDLLRALRAYNEAYPFLDLLESPALPAAANEADKLYTNAAEKEYTLLEKEVKCIAREETEEATIIIIGLGEKAKREIKGKYTQKDSVDWWAAAANNSLYKICYVLKNMEGINHMTTERLLAGVIFFKLRDAGRAVVMNCREWAKEMMEEKIRAAVYITGKLDGVMQAYRNANEVPV